MDKEKFLKLSEFIDETITSLVPHIIQSGVLHGKNSITLNVGLLYIIQQNINFSIHDYIKKNLN